MPSGHMAWTADHVRRLFWRAGFGATDAEVARFAAAGQAAAVAHLLDPGPVALTGPEPTVGGAPLKVGREWGHDVLWWLDRMVRTNHPLQERMTLIWSDHWATRETPDGLALRMNRTLRNGALGSFPKLLHAATIEPAMLLFLSLAGSDPHSPNENYARESMELHTLGGGYTERDVRESARALTGWKVRWTQRGYGGVFYSERDRDRGVKRILGERGRFDYRDVLRILVAHRRHAPFLVGKLWAAFVTEPLDAATRRRLVQVYVSSGHRIAPLVREILLHPALYAGLDAPQMVRSPAVHIASLLRTTGRPVDSDAWTWLLEQMGQSLFAPPSPAGWDGGGAWLSSGTMRARFLTATFLLEEGPAHVADDSTPLDLPPAEHLERALAAVGRPWASAATRGQLEALAAELQAAASKPWQRQTAADHTQRALRHLLLSGPDGQLA